MTPRDRILCAVTEYDRRAERRKGHNRYALPQYLGALQDVYDPAVVAGASVRSALCETFTGRLLAACLKAVGEAPPTEGELR